MRKLFLLLLLTIGAQVASTPAAQLRTLGPFGGDVRSLAVHPAQPRRLFLGTASGHIYVSYGGGTAWQKLRPGLGLREVVVDNLVFDPVDPEVLYAGCWALKSARGWLYRTTDGGTTWENLPLGEYGSQVRAVAVSPRDPNTLAVGIAEGVLLSTDRGQTWRRITRGYRSLHNVESLAFDPEDSQTLYVGTWRLGWKTKNLGLKWEPIHQGMPFDSDMFSLLVHPLRTEVLFASACTGVFRSSDSGVSWTRLRNGLPPEAKRTRTLHMDPSDPDTVYAGTTVGLFVSRDAGHSWTRLFGDVVVNAVVVEPSNPEVIIVGADDIGVLRSVDGGETFAPANSGFVHRQIAALEADPREPSTFYAAVAADGPHGGLFVARDLGRDWTPFNEGLDPTGSSIGSIRAGSHSREVFLGTMRGVFRGIPGTQPWQLVDSTTRMWIKDLDFADREQTALALATSDGLFRLDLHSERVERWIIPVYDGAVHGVILDEDSDALFAATDMGVFRLDQGEGTWRIKAIGLPPIRVNLVARGGKRLFCGTSQGVFFSDDNAETWNRSPESPVFDIVRIRANPEKPSEVYALDATSLFLFQSRDGGLNWEQVVWFDRARVSQVAFVSSGRLLAGTMAEGVYLVDSLPLSTNGNEE